MSNSTNRTQSEQKRQQGRLKVTIDGHYRFEGDEDWLQCTIFDISANGIALGGKKSFYSGDKIEVRFGIEKKTVVMHVEITNLIGRKAGGKIVKIDNAEKDIIQEVLNRQLLAGKNRLD
ncbi:MAG: PilZ domain-containing protein [Leptospiraceae bacterium]|nr:PilZ domain-containing protein [Leptospiraceae bacterium]